MFTNALTPAFWQKTQQTGGRPGKRFLLAAALAAAALVLPAAELAGWQDHIAYAHSAVVCLVSGCFCVAAGNRAHHERYRWHLAALSQALFALVYTIATLRLALPLTYDNAARLANLLSATATALILPALLGARSGRGTPLRLLDGALTVLASALLMFALGSGARIGDGVSRIHVRLLTLAVVSALALVTRFADGGPGLRRFTVVFSRFLWLDSAAYFLSTVVFLDWYPNVPAWLADPVIAMPSLWLCYASVYGKSAAPFRPFKLDRAAIDSLQPSVLTVSSVVLALFAFRRNSLLAGTLVVAAVLLYAVRTQLFYSRLFRERRRLHQQAEHLHELATRDPLTGIGNRRWFEERTIAALQRADAYPCSLLLVDTDHFKQINDGHGHSRGDDVLCMIADVLQREIGMVDGTTIARIGGDEFAALLPGHSQTAAAYQAEHVREAVQTLSQARGQGATVSIGVATAGVAASRADLLQAADEALYRAKAAGRNAVALHAMALAFDQAHAPAV